jgi:PAS domain S-box-containing protein
VPLQQQDQFGVRANPGLQVLDPSVSPTDSGQAPVVGWQQWATRYGAALAAAAVALGIWFLWPLVREDPFILFLAAVILTARFFGFGPALFCTSVSLVAIDTVAFNPPWTLSLGANDLERLLVFLLVSVLSASLARQRSRAESKAGEARQRMAAIVESSDDAIFSTTRDGVITSWNHGAETLYGYSAAEVIGRPVSLVVPPERDHEVLRHTARLNRGEYVESFQTERMRKDGTRVSILLSISPLRNHKGEVVGSSGIARDISAQKRSEEALRRSEKLATAGRLAAAIAHEINNPLEALLNLLYLARRDPSKADEYLGVAEREVQRIATIAQQTLGLVRDAAFALPVNVAEILEDVLQLYARKLEGKHIRIEKRYGKNLEVHGFPGELRQVFANLIVNAVDAMGDGGRLGLHVTGSREWSYHERPGVRVTIADNGSGIHPDEFAHLFEPFYTTKHDVGTGLGLWLSHNIVQKHGGWIRVRSSTRPRRNGTAFTIFLPERLENPKAA